MGGPGPFLGQVHHFVKFNPGKSAYAEERYAKEARRLWGVLDRRLSVAGYHARAFKHGDSRALAGCAKGPHGNRGGDPPCRLMATPSR